jgi:predicted PurR-regulated permease PerM
MEEVTLMPGPRTPECPASVNGTFPPAARHEPRLPMSEFARRVVVAVLITLVILVVAYVMWRDVHVLAEAFAGVLFATFLAALSDWLSRQTRLSYRWSLVVVVALFAIAGGLVYFLGSRLSAQVGELTQTLPRSFQRIRAYLEQHTWGKYLLENAPGAASGFVEAGSFSRLTGLISGVAGFVEAAIVILIVGIFGAAEPDLYKQGLFHLVPPRHRAPGKPSTPSPSTCATGWWGRCC